MTLLVNLVLAILLLVLQSVFGQADQVKAIDRMVAKIENNQELKSKEFDAAEVFGHTFDGGGTITIHTVQNKAKKIEQVIGLSYGRVTTVIYLDVGKPIKIIETEENFPVLTNQTGLDYSQLKKIFEASIYVFDWDGDNAKTIIKGERKLSKGTCALFDYEPIIEMAAGLIKE